MARQPAPQRLRQIALVMPSDDDGLSCSPWCLTGKAEYRRRWFGSTGLRIEEVRREYRSDLDGWTPRKWVLVYRWRWATNSEIRGAGVAWLQEQSAKIALDPPDAGHRKPQAAPRAALDAYRGWP